MPPPYPEGNRGRKGKALYRARRILLTGADLLTEAQVQRLETLFADERHAPVQAYRAEGLGLEST